MGIAIQFEMSLVSDSSRIHLGMKLESTPRALCYLTMLNRNSTINFPKICNKKFKKIHRQYLFSRSVFIFNFHIIVYIIYEYFLSKFIILCVIVFHLNDYYYSKIPLWLKMESHSTCIYSYIPNINSMLNFSTID